MLIMPKFLQPNNKRESQAGITLLMSVLVVSTLFLISIAVTTLVVQEIRATRSTRLTEPAIIAAESAGEQGLFIYKQTGVDIPRSCTPATGYTSTVSGGCGNSAVRVSKTISYDAVIIPLTPSEVKVIYLYDPAAKDTNTTMMIGADPVYDTFALRHVTGTTPVDVSIETLDGVPVAGSNVNRKTTGTFIVNSVIGSTDKRMKVTITAGASPTTVELSTSGYYSWDGIPDYPTIQAEACSAPTSISSCSAVGTEVYRRRLDITVPR